MTPNLHNRQIIKNTIDMLLKIVGQNLSYQIQKEKLIYVE